jgi:hypothetical protein
MFQNVLVVSVLCYSKWFHVASCKCYFFGCFTCSTHMLQVHVSSVSSVLIRMLYSKKISCCKCFILFDRASRGAGGRCAWRAEGCRWGCWGQADGCSGQDHAGSPLSSAPPRAEREEWVWGMTGGCRYGGGVRVWGGAKPNESGAMADWSGLRGHPDARVRLDVRALATTIKYT